MVKDDFLKCSPPVSPRQALSWMHGAFFILVRTLFAFAGKISQNVTHLLNFAIKGVNDGIPLCSRQPRDDAVELLTERLDPGLIGRKSS